MTQRAGPPWEIVAARDVPIFRALALALDHAELHGARFSVLSADRRPAVLARFNARHRTGLHDQRHLFEHRDQPGFAGALPPDRSSHCLRSDGHPAYRVDDRIIPAGGRLPDYMLGIDACDAGSLDDCSGLTAVLEGLGYHVTRPYHDGTSAHHFVFSSDPVPVLRHWRRLPGDVTAPAA